MHNKLLLDFRFQNHSPVADLLFRLKTESKKLCLGAQLFVAKLRNRKGVSWKKTFHELETIDLQSYFC